MLRSPSQLGFMMLWGQVEMIEFAFKLACNSLQIEGIDQSPEPILIKKGQDQAVLEIETQRTETQSNDPVPTPQINQTATGNSNQVLDQAYGSTIINVSGGSVTFGPQANPTTSQSNQQRQQLPREFKFETRTTETQIKLWSVPTLPPHFLARSETIKTLKSRVLSLEQPVVVTGQSQRMGIQGMGGIGKTVLATALAYDSEIQTAFPDGIYWLTVGVNPNLLSLQANLVEALDGDRLVFDDLNQGKTKLRELWQGKQSLLILDDVWHLADAEAFNALSDHSTLLVTTRDAGLVTGLGANSFSLDVLNDAQALELLAAWADKPVASLPPETKAIADECGNLPLALAQCGAMVRDFSPWEDILSDLQGDELEAISYQFSHYPDTSVFKALHKSALVLEETNPIAAERYQEFAVFPADTLIPESVVMQLWQYTGGLTEKDARKILAMLTRKGMLRLEGDYPNRLISLHDLQQDYLQSQVSDRSGLHGQLLSAYQSSCSDGWHSGPNDGYFYEHLASHLKEAEREDELRSLLLDYCWIKHKLDVTNINALLLDYEVMPSDSDLKLVASGLRLSSHVLSQRPEELRSQIYGRLLSLDTPGLRDLKRSLLQNERENWCRSLCPSLTQAGGALLRTLSGHSDSVFDVTVSPDGQFIISASWDKTLKVWDLETGKELRTLSGHSEFVHGVAVSPDGQFIISASWDKTLKVWDLETGKELRTLSGHSEFVYSVTVSPDNQFIISTSGDKTLKVWELATGKELYTLVGHTKSVYCAAVSPDGQFIISASEDKSLKVWELLTGKELLVLCGHSEPVYSVTVSPDNQFIISASGDKTLRVWQLATGKKLRTISGNNITFSDVTMSPNGHSIISSSRDKTLKVWDFLTGKELGSVIEHSDSVLGVTVSPNGQFIVTASADKSIKVWDLALVKGRSALSGHSDSVSCLTVSSDGRFVFSASEDRTLRVWDLLTRENWQTLSDNFFPFKSVAVSPDGQLIISAQWINEVKVWELSTGKELRTLSGHTFDVNCVAVSPDGKLIISAQWFGALKIWELSTGKELRTLSGHTFNVNRIAVSYDGKFIIAPILGTQLRVWELETGEEVHTLSGHNSHINSVTVSPNSQFIITASNDNTVKIWELATGKELRTLCGHTSHVNDVIVSLDNQFILSASIDKTLKIWELATGKELINFTGEGVFQCCAFTPNGRTVVAGDSGGQLYFLHLEGPKFSNEKEAIA